MVKYENHCVGCDHCMGFACPYKKVPVYYCDKCKDELDEVYEVDGEELCERCLLDKFRRE